jgi:hypothetical protein
MIEELVDLNVMLDRILKEAIVANVESESIEGPTHITSTFRHDSLSPGPDSMPGFSEEAAVAL